MISTLPAATSPKFCFTLDTEPDDLWQYRSENRFEHFSRLPRFHDLIAGRGARLTYLTTSEVAEDRTARQVMSKILDTRSAELGAHFHTWTRVWPFRTSNCGTPRSRRVSTTSVRSSKSKCSRYRLGPLYPRYGRGLQQQPPPPDPPARVPSPPTPLWSRLAEAHGPVPGPDAGLSRVAQARGRGILGGHGALIGDRSMQQTSHPRRGRCVLETVR